MKCIHFIHFDNTFLSYNLLFPPNNSLEFCLYFCLWLSRYLVQWSQNIQVFTQFLVYFCLIWQHLGVSLKYIQARTRLSNWCALLTAAIYIYISVNWMGLQMSTNYQTGTSRNYWISYGPLGYFKGDLSWGAGPGRGQGGSTGDQVKPQWTRSGKTDSKPTFATNCPTLNR